MKQIILYAIMLGSGIVNFWLGISIAKQKAVVAQQTTGLKSLQWEKTECAFRFRFENASTIAREQYSKR